MPALFEIILAVAVFLAFTALPWSIVAHKIGYSPWWGLIAAVPIVNFFYFVIYVVVRNWPIQDELRRHTGGLRHPEDSSMQSSWELKRLGKRAAIVKDIGTPNADAFLQQAGKSPLDFCVETEAAIQRFHDKVSAEFEQATALITQVQDRRAQIAGG